MKAVILAGGIGSRLSEETAVRPKPMVEIGGRPMLWHIMKGFSAHGINDFVVCLGYKGNQIKDFFARYYLEFSDVTFDLAENAMEVHQSDVEPWRVTLVDTGDQTMTGGRLKRVLPHVAGESFCFTYGDGLSDVDITALVAFHHEQGTVATVTAVQRPGLFGTMDLGPQRVRDFREKPSGEGSWINGGYFVLSPAVERYLGDDTTVWERGPVEALVADDELAVWRHEGFWHCMDTLRDRLDLEALWAGGAAPWRTW